MQHAEIIYELAKRLGGPHAAGAALDAFADVITQEVLPVAGWLLQDSEFSTPSVMAPSPDPFRAFGRERLSVTLWLIQPRCRNRARLPRLRMRRPYLT